MFTIFQCFPVSTFSKLTPCLIIWDYRNPKFVEPWWNFHKKKHFETRKLIFNENHLKFAENYNFRSWWQVQCAV